MERAWGPANSHGWNFLEAGLPRLYNGSIAPLPGGLGFPT